MERTCPVKLAWLPGGPVASPSLPAGSPATNMSGGRKGSWWREEAHHREDTHRPWCAPRIQSPCEISSRTAASRTQIPPPHRPVPSMHHSPEMVLGPQHTRESFCVEFAIPWDPRPASRSSRDHVYTVHARAQDACWPTLICLPSSSLYILAIYSFFLNHRMLGILLLISY